MPFSLGLLIEKIIASCWLDIRWIFISFSYPSNVWKYRLSGFKFYELDMFLFLEWMIKSEKVTTFVCQALQTFLGNEFPYFWSMFSLEIWDYDDNTLAMS